MCGHMPGSAPVNKPTQILPPRASDARDNLLPTFLAMLKKRYSGTLVVTKEGDIDAIIGNYRTVIMTKEEIAQSDWTKVDQRVKKALEHQ